MTPQQIEAIKTSWKKVAKLDAVVVGQLFYARLFEIKPELSFLFRNPQPEQSKKLMATLGYIVSKLDRLDDLSEDIQRLAQRHVQYGVKENHYINVGAALLWTLKRGLGVAWTREIEQAWTECYAILSSAIINASQEAELV